MSKLSCFVVFEDHSIRRDRVDIQKYFISQISVCLIVVLILTRLQQNPSLTDLEIEVIIYRPIVQELLVEPMNNSLPSQMKRRGHVAGHAQILASESGFGATISAYG